jgi:hypothetical protein
MHHTRCLTLAFVAAFLTGCITYPKAPAVTPQQRAQAAKVKTGPFAWGISSSSWQYENRETGKDGKPVKLKDGTIKQDCKMIKVRKKADQVTEGSPNDPVKKK